MLAPLVRRRVPAPPLLTQTLAFAAPVALGVAVRRTHARDVAVCALQMWAYTAAYKTPHDNSDAQARRVRIDYPIDVDRVLGLGRLPTERLQAALARVGPDDVGDGGQRWHTLDKVLVWTHWSWFLVPHGALVYIMLRHPDRFERAAVMTYATFDLGAMFYWVLPTAPPWYAAVASETGLPQTVAERGDDRGKQGEDPGERREDRGERREDPDGQSAASGGAVEPTPLRTLAVRRMMVEYGQDFWGDNWTPLYSVFGGNPLAAMPSLHFATSVMAASLLADTGPLAGALGWAYAGTLGLALVYLGEHYAVDLLAGLALTGAVRRLGPRAGPVVRRAGNVVAALEASAHAAR